MDYLPFMREPSLLDKVWMSIRYPIDLVSSPFQALLSIPALSFFVIPAFSSYSTTVNFFFFYLTWAILIKSNNPLKVEVFGTLGVRTFFFLLPSLGFLFFDSTSPNLAVGIKQHGKVALPMGEAQGGWRGRWWKIALVSSLNMLLGVAIQLLTELVFTHLLYIRSALKISTTPPLPWSIAKDLVLSLLLRELLTYVLHRFILHSPRSRLAKWHMAWQHSVKAPFSLVAHYDHPVTYLIHIFLPTYLPAVLLRLHLLTYNVYIIIVSLEETFAYSGYNALPSAFILGGIARRQERHLMGSGDGNYGCFGLVDFLLGTSVGGTLVDDVVDEAEEKEVGKKAKSKAKGIKNKAQKQIEPEKSTEEDEEQASEEAEPQPTRKRRSKKSDNSDSVDNSEQNAGSTPTRRKASGQTRKSKKSSDEGEAGSGGVQEKDEKPKRKASTASRNGKKTSGRGRKKADPDEE